MFEMKSLLMAILFVSACALAAGKLTPTITIRNLSHAWGGGVRSENVDGSLRLTAKDATGPAALAAVNVAVVAGSECTFHFEARGNVRLQVMLTCEGSGKSERLDIVLPTQLTDEWLQVERKFTVPAGVTRLNFNFLIWKQTGFADIREFQFLQPVVRREIMLFDECFRQGALVNNVFSPRIPAGWSEWRGSGVTQESDTGGLSKEYSFVSKEFNSLKIPASVSGEKGWISSAIPLDALPRPMRLTADWRVTSDFSNNRSAIRLLYYNSQNKLLAQSSAFPLPTEKSDRWSSGEFQVTPRMIPPGTASMRVLLLTARDGRNPPAGSVYFGQVRIMSCENEGSFAKIRGGAPLNWFRFGDPVSFRAEGPLPEGSSAVTGKIMTAEGNKVAEITVPVAEFEERGWQFKPVEPGFYLVDFSATTPVGEISLAEEYQERAANNQIGRFTPPGGHSFAVVRERTTAGEPSELLGYQFNGATQPMKLAGGRFTRIHITWMDLEPEKGKFTWSRLDDFVNRCVADGIKPVICFYGTPRWASNNPDDTRYVVHVWAYNAYAPRDLRDWTDFVGKMTERYKDRVDTWEVWNEPHLPGYSCYWHDTPENFVAILKSAYETIKRIQPDSKIWMGGIALRYLPFYDKILSLGAGKYFDYLAIHGFGQQIAPFYALDKKHGSPVHPWVNSEWHACLLHYTDQAYKLTEEQRNLRMMLDLFRMVQQKVRMTAFFQPFNLAEKETLRFHTEGGMPLNHSSGIFRLKPYPQPLLGAVVMANFSRHFSGNISLKSGYRFGDQKAALFRSDSGNVLAFWQTTSASQPVAAELSGAISGAVVEDWEGRPVADPQNFRLRPSVLYYAIAPKIIADRNVAQNVLVDERPALPLKHDVSGVYTDKPLFSADWMLLPKNIRWNRKGFGLYRFDAASETFEKPTRFAVAIFDGKLQMVVETRDEKLYQPAVGGGMWQGDSLEIAFDPESLGYDSDRIEFIAGKGAKGDELFKSANLTLVGDLPTAWTPPGTTVETGRVNIIHSRLDKTTCYMLEFPVSELYPIIPSRSKRIRFSLLVNENDGKCRIAASHWGGGIYGGKNPALYGDLKAE